MRRRRRVNGLLSEYPFYRDPADSAAAVGSKKDVCMMTLHTFPAQAEVKTCTTILLDNTNCTNDTDRRENGENRECYKCGEPVCKRHHVVLTPSWPDFFEARYIAEHGALIVCTTCNAGTELAVLVKRLSNAAEDAYEGKVRSSVRELDDLVDDLVDVMGRLRDATTADVLA